MMSRDDLHVLMYKVLSYFYSSMKQGIRPDNSMIGEDGALFFGIPSSYRAAVFSELVDKDLIKGVSVKSFDNETVVFINSPRVTLEGVEFLHENTMMRKAANYLKEVKDSVPLL